MPFTSRLGINLTKPGNIALGGGTFNPTRTINIAPASLRFSGNVSSAIASRLLYSSIVTVISQIRNTFKSRLRQVTLITQTRTIPLKVVQRTTTQLDSVPLSLDIAVTETYPYSVDVTQYLSGTDTISSISAVLTLVSTGQVVPTAWQGTISTAGNVIQVPIIGSVLLLGQQYQLATTFTANTNKRLTVLTLITIVA